VVATAQSLGLYVVGFAWVVLAYAAHTRRRALAAAGALLAAVQVAWLVPEVHPQGRVDLAALTAPHLRVFSANLRVDNTHIAAVVAEIRAADPDVLSLQEYDTENRAAFEASGLLAAYPYQVTFEQDSVFGALLASRVPFRRTSAIEVGERGMPLGILDTPIGPVAVACVHLNRPITTEEYRLWASQNDVLRIMVRDRTEPMILAGDFNATTQNGPFRAVLRAGIVDAHQSLGDGLSSSWPKVGPLPRLLRLDHVLVTPELVVTRVRNGRGAGSDHAPVIADIALVGRA
jgi:endonuclease/exonuclease/phosphatase (EEP) superfamily protein YafD